MRGDRKSIAAVESSAARDGMALDPAQRQLLDRLADLRSNLDQGSFRRASSRGLYVHGQAGRGKSWLADAFYTALPTTRKTRVHFHGFFDKLHRSIHDHRSERDAVERAIDEVTGNSQLLFFDELHVHDSGDARLLTRLLENVFRRELTVLATSNYAPTDLLPNPIWHHIFEPGIELIKNNMDVFHLDGPIDYRTTQHDHSTGFASGTWTTTPPAPLPGIDEAATAHVRGRHFRVLATRSKELWATFAQLCESPTSIIEYLEWSRAFPRWIVTDVPLFDSADAESQQRFINLVDVLVDANVSVSFVSTHDLRSFLAGASHRPDAFRMASRLHLLRTEPDIGRSDVLKPISP